MQKSHRVPCRRRKAGKPMASSSLLEKVLHRRIQETYDNSTPSVDQIVDSFRERYPEYRRHKLQRFTGMVKRSLDLNCNSKGNKKSKRKFEDSRSIFNDDDEDDNTSPSFCSPSSKKAKKIDSREHMLQTQSGSSSSEPESESYSVDGEEEEDKSVVLTSDKPKNVELEVVTSSKNKETQTVDIMKDRRVKPVVKAKAQKPSNSLSSDDGVDANGKEDGPRFKDLGGMDAVIKDLRRRVIIPSYHPEHLRNLGVSPTAGILLHGPSGCGKTTLALAIANETGFPLYKISAPELVKGISGASEENIRELFSKAYSTAPSIVFIDEIDSIASKRENLQRETERRIVTQLMTCMDQSHRVSKSHVLVIGATNRPDALDPAIRRPGRFDREIALGVPDQNARFQILKVVTRDMKLERNFDLMKIARATPGFVGADLADLAKEAGRNVAMGRIIEARELEIFKESEENEDWWQQEAWPVDETECITMLDFEGALTSVQPSSKREGFSSIPKEKWEDVGGLDSLRKEFERYIVKRIRSPDKYEKGGVNMATGFLLYGPPGCGKTLIAKAVANEAGANFIHIKGPELLNKYVGESELSVRTTFSRARKCSPCIVFFDEVDALTTKRGNEGGWAERLVNQLLLELDGADQRKGVYVIGATNRPDVMDQAFLRPGRFEKLLYVPLPSPDERVMILKALARKKPIDADVDLIAIGRSEACANFSGADLSALMNEAAIAAIEESESSIDSLPYTIKAIHIEQALGKICPSVSDEQEQYYHRLPKRFKSIVNTD